MDIARELARNQLVVLLLPGARYATRLVAAVKLLRKRYKKICYVSLSKPYTTVLEELKAARIPTDGFFFIDAAAECLALERRENAVCVGSAEDLTGLGVQLALCLKEFRPDLVLLDSLSTLLIYNSPGASAQFAHFVAGEVRLAKTKGVFVALMEDKDSPLMKEVELFVDRVLG